MGRQQVVTGRLGCMRAGLCQCVGAQRWHNGIVLGKGRARTEREGAGASWRQLKCITIWISVQ
jgi:hypothetical protein